MTRQQAVCMTKTLTTLGLPLSEGDRAADLLTAWLAAAVAEETGRCAGVCDVFAEKWGCEAEECATAIREGKTPEEIRERLKGV